MTKPSEDDAFGPLVIRAQEIEILLGDDQFERLEELMPRLVRFQLDHVHAHVLEILFYDIRGYAQVHSANVARDSQIGATPRHGTTAWFFTNHDVSISRKVGIDSAFRRITLFALVSWLLVFFALPSFPNMIHFHFHFL